MFMNLDMKATDNASIEVIKVFVPNLKKDWWLWSMVLSQ